jgi:hypothetical protein
MTHGVQMADQPYTARELYMLWRNSSGGYEIDDERILRTLFSLNKPAFEMAALLSLLDPAESDRYFGLVDATANYDAELDDSELEYMLSPLVIRCCAADAVDIQTLKTRFPCVAERIDIESGDNKPEVKPKNLARCDDADAAMSVKSIPNLEMLAHICESVVSYDWVRFAANHWYIESDPDTSGNGIKVDTTARAMPIAWVNVKSGDNKGHVHAISNDIAKFVDLFQRVPEADDDDDDGNVRLLTWQFRLNGPVVLVYSSLEKHTTLVRRLRSMSETPCELMCVACSIGLPLHGVFTPWQFLKQWVSEQWSRLETTESLVLLSLRRRLAPLLHELGTDIHWTQLLELYRKNHKMFEQYDYSLLDTAYDIDAYFFKHVYQYPQPGEWSSLMGRVAHWIEGPVLVNTGPTATTPGKVTSNNPAQGATNKKTIPRARQSTQTQPPDQPSDQPSVSRVLFKDPQKD